jgi:ABC-2 type transport system permease protein
MKNLVASTRIFLSSAWLSYVALLYWTQPITYLASHVAAPFTYILFFSYLGISATGSDTAKFYLIGNALHLCSLNGIYGVTMAIGNERDAGTLVYLVASPSNRLIVFLGRTFFNIIDGVITVSLGLAWSMFLGLDLTGANWSGIFLTILITTISTCGLGLLLGSVSFLSLNVLFVNNTVFFLLLLFSGANLPADSMPTWMQAVGSLLPLTRGIKATRLLADGAQINEVLPLLFGEMAVGAIYGIAGYAVIHSLENIARKRGSLDAY